MNSLKIGIIGGSGLNNPNILKDGKEVHVKTPFGDPSDSLIEGNIEGVPCVLLPRHGRKHSIMPGNVNFRANLWALKSLGCTHVIVSTACGSLQEHIAPGDFVIIDTFIDRTTKRIQTFYDGSTTECQGILHLPMFEPFCPRSRKIMYQTAQDLGYKTHDKGTMVTIEGPRFSSKAESKMFKQWGGDVINMTTVPEVILANELGLCYAAIAMATDYDCWREDEEPVNVEKVLATFKSNAERVIKVLTGAIKKIAQEDWADTINKLKTSVQSSIMLPQ
ncbi:unnamed protein product, partial [Meganyctiphanes norvegica]